MQLNTVRLEWLWMKSDHIVQKYFRDLETYALARFILETDHPSGTGLGKEW